MSFRSRVSLLVTLAVALAFVLASLIALATSRRSLLAAVDAQLVEAVGAGSIGAGPPSPALQELQQFVEDQRREDRLGPGRRRVRPGGAGGDVLRGIGVVQLVGPSGAVVLSVPEDADPVPTPGWDRTSLGAGGLTSIETVRTDDTAYRTIGAGVVGGNLIQVARPIDDIEDGLDRQALLLGLASLAGIALAFVAGRLVASRVVEPVRELTRTAELIAETEDLAHRAQVSGEDELARLGASLNRMLVALDRSRRSQQQLVADASHELRTPLTSLRTNIELLSSAAELSEDDRAAMRRDVIGQIEEMTLLIGNLVDLAREDAETVDATELALDEVVATVVERQRRLHPDAAIELEARPSVVLGDRDRIDRAVTNLVDNAVKYAGADGPVEVSVAEGVVRVRDHGPGVPDEDRARVFDRFWRSPATRGAPGSGLGLAIVRQVAVAHGGDVSVDAAPGGGAVFELALPTRATA